MRLLNTSTLLLEEFVASPPPYAILSHTWASEEVLFTDIGTEIAAQKKGFEKIETCCEIALSEGYAYVWIDTCCINKASSAELSEAINSMFGYYKEAGSCYVYLDVDLEGEYLTIEELRGARWAHRGWTLQELIAPSYVQIYSKHWQLCGTRRDLARQLCEVTGIALDILQREEYEELNLSTYSTAQRMSWASNRQTTRPEDIAYCLLGIFNIHLPPLYGEGATKAFFRLQEELLKHSTDLSILAWSSEHLDLQHGTSSMLGALAPSPAYFTSSSNILRVPAPVESFRLTNKGIHLTVPLIKDEENSNQLMTHYYAILRDCRFENDFMSPIGIRISQLGTATDKDDFFRYLDFVHVKPGPEIQTQRRGDVPPQTLWLPGLEVLRRAIRVPQTVSWTPEHKERTIYIRTNVEESFTRAKECEGCFLDINIHPFLTERLRKRNFFFRLPSTVTWDPDKSILSEPHPSWYNERILAPLHYGVMKEPLAILALRKSPSDTFKLMGIVSPWRKLIKKKRRYPNCLDVVVDGLELVLRLSVEESSAVLMDTSRKRFTVFVEVCPTASVSSLDAR